MLPVACTQPCGPADHERRAQIRKTAEKAAAKGHGKQARKLAEKAKKIEKKAVKAAAAPKKVRGPPTRVAKIGSDSWMTPGWRRAPV